MVAHGASEGARGPARATSARRDAGPPRQRLAGLDGLRGVAALFVVVNHVFLPAFPGYPVDRAPFWAAPFIYGRFAVDVFIVLSGFSLALSPARHGWRLDGLSRFARRRASRILPAYWAALAFSLAVAWLVAPPPGSGVPDAKSVVVNGLLVQNLVGAPSPNRSLWSIAVEAQLYLMFPLLLLMVRRWGVVVMVATVTLVVAAVGILAPHVSRLEVFVVQSAPDLAALFAVGVVSAGIARASGALRAWPWAGLALAASVPVLAMIGWHGSVWTLDHLFWVDLALAPAVGCLLAGLATGRAGHLARLLDARPLRGLGSSSYSLYLTHGPIVVVICDKLVVGRVRQGVPAFVLSLALVVPLTIAFARVFASVFETPSDRCAQARTRRARAIAAGRATVWRAGRGPSSPGSGIAPFPATAATRAVDEPAVTPSVVCERVARGPTKTVDPWVTICACQWSSAPNAEFGSTRRRRIQGIPAASRVRAGSARRPVRRATASSLWPSH